MCLQERNGRLHLLHQRHEWGCRQIVEETAYDLALDAAGSRVLQQGGEGVDFWAYLDDGQHVHYVSYWLSRKIKRLKLPHAQADTLEVVAPHFALADGRLYCRGTRVVGADPATFVVVPETRFACDARHVYAFTMADGLGRWEYGGGPLYFLPQCEYFADRERFYRQSSWTNRIEPVEARTRIVFHEKNTVLRACLWQGRDAADEDERRARAALLDRVISVGDLFRLLLPETCAAWNPPRPAPSH